MTEEIRWAGLILCGIGMAACIWYLVYAFRKLIEMEI